ncbi:TPR repeat-containing thioredoxin TTL1 [Musa troglodytarum]|uniref:TPR repeat-containing thioredoxin TTL1 n=1 Tax=Musa troglodytarum TaxID=320322 RepID=A0A9E7KN45_9LILI|nr:TPR repeat-containing thioredoxin TTL1 [Musa troglodytarum]
MSRAGETSRPDQKAGSGLAAPGQVEPVADRFQAALRMEENKPDFPDLGSPVSPLRPCPANSSSSSSSSGSYSGKVALPPHSPSDPAARMPAAPDPGRRSHYGELSGEISQRQSGSGLLIFSVGSGCGGSSCTASSPNTNVLPTGNIYPSGKIGKTGMMPRTTPRSDVLGSGTGNYGHGSIMRGGMSGGGAARPSGGASMGNSVDSMTRRATRRMDPQEVTRAGNEHYKRGQYGEALAFYDRAVAMCPENAACRSNRAAALMGLDRLREAVRECEETVRLDPANERAHHRLACLNLRLGLVEDARKHLLLTGQPPDPVELQKTRAVERHLVKCGDTRKIGDWKSALREADAAIAEGADSCPLFDVSQLIALRAEALLHLQHPDEADSVLSRPSEFEDSLPLSSATKIFGMLSSSYFYIVRAQVDMAMGRFDNAVTAAEKARKVDARNIEVTMVMSNVRSVARARAQGNELFKLGNFSEACAAYGEGLRYDPSNSVLLCNRAACRSKLGQWQKSVDDCSEALRIRPNYTKALLRRADSFSKLECWAECVRDYEVLRKELPWDSEVAEALFHAQVALKTCRGEDVSNLKFGGEVEEVTSIEQFRAAISFPGTSVVYFMVASNPQCTQITPSVDALCNRYPSANFLRVDINRSPDVAKAENVRIVPTFKIYKNGTRVKEMICPSQQVLEYSVRHYSL